MSCASGSSSERLQKSEIDKWVSSINQMLASESGRNEFINFLSERGFEKEVIYVMYWEKCDSVQNKIMIKRQPPSNDIRKELNELVELADEHILFSLTELNSIYDLLYEQDSVKIFDTLISAKTSITQLLDKYHKKFSEHILKKYRTCCH